MKVPTPEEIQLLMLRGHIAGLDDDTRSAVKAAEGSLRAVLAQYPDGEGLLALALIGAEEAAKP